MRALLGAWLVIVAGAAGAHAQPPATASDDDAPANQPTSAPPSDTQPSDAPAAAPAPRSAEPTSPSATAEAGPRRPTSSTPAREDGEGEGAADADPDEEEEENWGVFWIEAQAGYSFVNLIQFNADNFIPEAEKLDGSGFFAGAALGFRLYFLTLGARATIASYFGFEVGTVGADVAVHLPIPVVSPYVRVGLGYAWMGDANWDDPALSQTDVHGLVVDGGVGVDIKLGRLVSLGGGFDAAFLNLGRQSARDAGTVGMVNLEESGDAAGLQLRVHAHLTFHI